MPRFHFHTEDGRRNPDIEGAELPDLAAAQVEASRFMAELVRERPEEIWRDGVLRVLITGGDGALLGVLILAAAGEPARP